MKSSVAGCQRWLYMVAARIEEDSQGRPWLHLARNVKHRATTQLRSPRFVIMKGDHTIEG